MSLATPLNRAFGWLIKLGLLTAVMIAWVPISPKMPSAGLDPSWALALNHAVALGLSFGHDIIFTLGPYSAIYTKAYHPATDSMMVLGSCYLALCYWLGLLVLMKDSHKLWTVGFAIALLTMVYSRDSLLFSYPLIVGLVCYKNRVIKARPKYYFILTLFTPFGLLPLVKGSLILLCTATLILCCVFFIRDQQKTLAGAVMVAVTGALLGFWLAAGQPLLDLPHYFFNSLVITSGFTEAMALDGSYLEIILYLLAAILVLLFLSIQRNLSYLGRFFLVGIFGAFLFLSFKTGFTRHFGHGYIAPTSLLITALLLPYLFKSRTLIPIIAFLWFTTFFIDSNYTHLSIRNNLVSTYSATVHGLKTRLFDKNNLHQNFLLSLDYLHQQLPIPELAGSTDIFSYEQTYLIASANHWSPRPVFQSYSVFNAKLALLNAQYLQANKRPDNILLKIEPIDNRLPALEDGSSWPVLLTHYIPTRMYNDFLLLQNKSSRPQYKLLSTHSKEHFFGEDIPVPNAKHPLFVQIEIKPTWWGRIALFLFKPSDLQISITLKTGEIKQYRFIGAMAQSGFLLSPLIENVNEFALLYQSKDFWQKKQIHSFSIHNNQNSYMNYWQLHFALNYQNLDTIEHLVAQSES